MNIALHDSERSFSKSRTKFPNLALMKISAYHKSKGDTVDWWIPIMNGFYDTVYSSKVFTFTADEPLLPPETIKGGTGYGSFAELPHEIDVCKPDYSIYPDCDYAVGFLTRGCIRSCPWCVVPQKEGKIRSYSAWQDVVREDSVKLLLMDNNIISCEHGIRQLAELSTTHYKIDCNQGLDCRLITPEIAKILSAIKWIKFVRFSCDTVEQIKYVKKAVNLLHSYGVAKHRFFVYTMVTADIQRSAEIVDELKKIGCITVYAQPQMCDDLLITKAQKEFCKRYVYGGKYRTETWTEYCEKRKLYF
jgi:hypothetical protein